MRKVGHLDGMLVVQLDRKLVGKSVDQLVPWKGLNLAE